MPSGIPIVVFSNVDSICDHPLTSADCWEAARLLRRLEREGAQLVLCSSRTRAEVESVQRSLDLGHPFVCERGSAALVPDGYFPFDLAETRRVAGYRAFELGRPASEIIQILQRTAARQKVSVVGFSDLSVEQVGRNFRLSLLQARLAKLLEYSERFRIIDVGPDHRARLFSALGEAGLRCLTTDRYHQVSAAVDPHGAAGFIYRLFRRVQGAVLSLGASDATTPFGGLLPAGRIRETTVIDWAQRIVDEVVTLRRVDSRCRAPEVPS